MATGCASVGCDSDLADGRDLADTWGQVWDILPAQWEKIKVWAEQAARALKAAAKLVDQATATCTDINAEAPATALADARELYDQAMLVGISDNLSPPWHKGNHPGLVLARRLQHKADEVWLFTKDTRTLWTNNASERALEGPKLHQKVSGYWQTTLTLSRYCRVRSYLVSARNHGLHAADRHRQPVSSPGRRRAGGREPGPGPR